MHWSNSTDVSAQHSPLTRACLMHTGYVFCRSLVYAVRGELTFHVERSSNRWSNIDDMRIGVQVTPSHQSCQWTILNQSEATKKTTTSTVSVLYMYNVLYSSVVCSTLRSAYFYVTNNTCTHCIPWSLVNKRPLFNKYIWLTSASVYPALSTG